MALECCHHFARRVVEGRGFRQPIAVGSQRALQPRHRVATVARPETGSFKIERRGAHPVTDAGFTEQAPWKFLARILLAGRRNVGMRKDTVGTDRPTSGDDRSAKRDDGRSLTQRKIWIAELMARIDDLDADRGGVDVGLALP